MLVNPVRQLGAFPMAVIANRNSFASLIGMFRSHEGGTGNPEHMVSVGRPAESSKVCLVLAPATAKVAANVSAWCVPEKTTVVLSSVRTDGATAEYSAIRPPGLSKRRAQWRP